MRRSQRAYQPEHSERRTQTTRPVPRGNLESYCQSELYAGRFSPEYCVVLLAAVNHLDWSSLDTGLRRTGKAHGRGRLLLGCSDSARNFSTFLVLRLLFSTISLRKHLIPSQARRGYFYAICAPQTGRSHLANASKETGYGRRWRCKHQSEGR